MADGERSLRRLIQSSDGVPSILIEAHDGLSARIVKESGAPGIWASGFSISTSLGFRDCSEVSWTQLLDVVENMRLVNDLPILADADSGFGDLNTLQRFVERVCLLGIQGVCLEDKVFPKRNSFQNILQQLVSIEEHCERLERVRRTAGTSSDLVVVARTESLISGNDVDDALRRAHAYAEAGADAIFIHSKAPDGAEIAAFARAWNGYRPLIVAPTTFPQLSIQDFGNTGVSVVLAANQLVRASLRAMREVAREIVLKQSIDVNVPPITDIFELMDYAALARGGTRLKADLDLLDGPIDPDALDLPENLWFELAFGVANHRYFLHVDDLLTAGFGLDFVERQRLFIPTESPRRAALARRVVDALLVDGARCEIDSEALRRAKALPIGSVVELGAMSVVATNGPVSVPAWARLLGIVGVPTCLSADDAMRALLGQAMENVGLAFLYAGVREGQLAGDSSGSVEDVAGQLLREHGDIVASLHWRGASLLNPRRPNRHSASDRAAPLLLTLPDYMPFSDFFHTLAGSRSYLDKYLRGLGIGQS